MATTDDCVARLRVVQLWCRATRDLWARSCNRSGFGYPRSIGYYLAEPPFSSNRHRSGAEPAREAASILIFEKSFPGGRESRNQAGSDIRSYANYCGCDRCSAVMKLLRAERPDAIDGRPVADSRK